MDHITSVVVSPPAMTTGGVSDTEISDKEWDVGQPSIEGAALRIVGQRETQVKQWIWPPGQWGRVTVTATRPAEEGRET